MILYYTIPLNGWVVVKEIAGEGNGFTDFIDYYYYLDLSGIVFVLWPCIFTDTEKEKL